MSARRTEGSRLRAVSVGFVGVGVGVGVGVSVVVSVSVSVVVSVSVSVSVVVGVVVLDVLDVLHRRRSSQAPASRHTVPPHLANPRSLRWVRGLLPGDEGAAWLAEVRSCLVEATDKSERRRYMRSYRRNVPQLIWTSWTEHLSASRQRELL